MSHEADVERYVSDPSLLVSLCREVIERLGAGTDNDGAVAMETQLREIARAIEKLDKQGVPVPDALRAEKTRLASALGVNAQAAETLNYLADELAALVKELRGRIGYSSGLTPAKKRRTKRSKSPKTDKTILRELIVEALRHFGGSASKNDVLRYMEDKLHDKLLPGDLEWREATNDHAWQNNACWERYAMTQDGTLKSGSPRGTWELSEDQ